MKRFLAERTTSYIEKKKLVNIKMADKKNYEGGVKVSVDTIEVVEVEDDIIQVSVEGLNSGQSAQVKIKKSDHFKNLMSEYCERFGLDMKGLKFLYDGRRVSANDCPNDLDLDIEDGDTMELQVVQKMDGGGSAALV